MPQAEPTPQEQPERDARPLRVPARRPRRLPLRTLACRALPRAVEELRAARPRSWHVRLTLARPWLLELTGFGKRRRTLQKSGGVWLVRQITDSPEVPWQERRPLGHFPAELVERGSHVARPARVLPIDVGHLVLRRARLVGPIADPRLFFRPNSVRIVVRIVDRWFWPEQIAVGHFVDEAPPQAPILLPAHQRFDGLVGIRLGPQDGLDECVGDELHHIGRVVLDFLTAVVVAAVDGVRIQGLEEESYFR